MLQDIKLYAKGEGSFHEKICIAMNILLDVKNMKKIAKTFLLDG